MPNPAEDALAASGLSYRLISHGPVRSLAEAAQARGVTPAGVVKTLVVRRGDDDFLFVLVPGDRTISWPKLRALLGVSRLSMPDAGIVQQLTGRHPSLRVRTTGPWPPGSRPGVAQITAGARGPG